MAGSIDDESEDQETRVLRISDDIDIATTHRIVHFCYNMPFAVEDHYIYVYKMTDEMLSRYVPPGKQNDSLYLIFGDKDEFGVSLDGDSSNGLEWLDKVQLECPEDIPNEKFRALFTHHRLLKAAASFKIPNLRTFAITQFSHHLYACTRAFGFYEFLRIAIKTTRPRLLTDDGCRLIAHECALNIVELLLADDFTALLQEFPDFTVMLLHAVVEIYDPEPLSAEFRAKHVNVPPMTEDPIPLGEASLEKHRLLVRFAAANTRKLALEKEVRDLKSQINVMKQNEGAAVKSTPATAAQERAASEVVSLKKYIEDQRLRRQEETSAAEKVYRRNCEQAAACVEETLKFSVKKAIEETERRCQTQIFEQAQRRIHSRNYSQDLVGPGKATGSTDRKALSENLQEKVTKMTAQLAVANRRTATDSVKVSHGGPETFLQKVVRDHEKGRYAAGKTSSDPMSPLSSAASITSGLMSPSVGGPKPTPVTTTDAENTIIRVNAGDAIPNPLRAEADKASINVASVSPHRIAKLHDEIRRLTAENARLHREMKKPETLGSSQQTGQNQSNTAVARNLTPQRPSPAFATRPPVYDGNMGAGNWPVPTRNAGSDQPVRNNRGGPPPLQAHNIPHKSRVILDALKDVSLDIRSCNNMECCAPFPVSFRGVTEDVNSRFLILKCTECLIEVHRWEL
ncbi:hypothetical protein AAFC00_001471 [Neodothiora populina]